MDDYFDITDVTPFPEMSLADMLKDVPTPDYVTQLGDYGFMVENIDPNELAAQIASGQSGGDWSKLAGTLVNALKSPAAIAGILGAGVGMSKYGKPSGGGWQGTIPKLTATRTQLPQPEYKPEYKPYSGEAVMGRQFFSPVTYSPKTTASSEVAKTKESDVATTEQTGPKPIYDPDYITNPNEPIPSGRSQELPDTTNTAAQGGIMKLAQGRYLRGKTDGMADQIPSSIEGRQPAALSHGEFIIPADVVSHLGNGNSDAGADVLYKMMDRVRQARTGTKKQGKQIQPEKFMPGGIANIKRFQAGGVSTGVTGSTTSTPMGTTTTGSLAPYVGDYVSDFLSRGLALSNEPYQAYTGALTAGVSPVQDKAFTQATGIAGTQFDPSKFMNPYIQSALQPTLDTLRRESDINQAKIQGQFSKAGAFGGAREAIARAENQRALMDAQARVTGQGYMTAFDRAMQAFQNEQAQEVADLRAMLDAGAAQRGVEQEGITAQKAAFEQEREDPLQKVKFAQSLLGGLPTTSSATEANTSFLQRLGLSAKQATDLATMIQDLLDKNKTSGTSTSTTDTIGG